MPGSLLLLAVLAACADPQSGARTPTGLVARASTSGDGYTLTVHVVEDPAPISGGPSGLLVVAFNTETGPYVNGHFASATTVDGAATLTDLPAGNYCVTVRDLPANAFGASHVAPFPEAADPDLASAGGTIGVITGQNLEPLAFTLANFTTYCATAGQGSVDVPEQTDVTIRLAAGASTLGYDFRDLNGDPFRPVAWTVIDLSEVAPAWFVAGSFPPDVKPGLLVSTTGSGGSAAGGVASNQTVVIQTALVPPTGGFDLLSRSATSAASSAAQGPLTATWTTQLTGSGDATTSSTPQGPPAVFATPLVCEVVPVEENAGDAGTSVDLVGLDASGVPSVKMGFGTDQALGAVDATRLAIWFGQLRPGSGTIHVRFVGGDVSGIQVDYTCSTTPLFQGSEQRCVETAVKGPKSDIVAHVFGTQDGPGHFRVTLVATNLHLPATGMADIQIRTSGDQFPDASRSGAGTPAGFYRLSVAPSAGSCDGGLGSDDRFWLN